MVQEYQRQFSREMTPFSAPSPSVGGGGGSATNYGAIQQALGQWFQQANEELRIRAQENVEGLAQRQQEEMGLERLSEAPEGLAARYQRMYANRARTVYGEKLKADSLRTANELSRAHRMDPGGFGAAWEEYATRTVEQVEQSDPTYASQLRMGLASMGVQAQDRIAQDVFERELTTQGMEVVESFNAQLAESRDYLLNNPSAEGLESMKSMLYETLAGADEAALLTPQQLTDMRIRISDDLATDYVQGMANRALGANDIRGAQTLVKRLRRGEWFEDNRAAERLAARIEQSIGGTGATESMRRPHIRMLSDMKAAAQMGIVLDDASMARARESLVFLQAHGTPAEFEAAQRNFMAAGILNEVLPQVAGAPRQTIDATINDFQTLEWVQAMGADTVRDITSALERERDVQHEATQRGDHLALSPYARGRTFDQMLELQSQGGPEAHDRAVAEARALAARNTGLPVQRIPLRTQAQTQEAVTRIDQAVAQGDMEEVTRLVDGYMGPYVRAGSSRAGAIELAERSDELGGAVLLASELAGVGGRTFAQWLNLSLQGKAAPRHQDIVGADFLRLDPEVREAISGGSGRLEGMAIASMKDVANGLLVTGQAASARDAIDEANRMVQRLPSTRIQNNLRVLEHELGDGPTEQQLARDTINDWLRENRDSPVPVESLRPRQVRPGVFRFYDVTTGMLYRPDSGEPFELIVGEEQIEEAREQDVTTRQEDAKAAALKVAGALDLATRERDNFALVGREAGVSDDDAHALWRAISTTPARERTRMPDGVPPEVMPQMLGGPLSTPLEQTPSKYAAQAARVLGREFSRRSVLDLDVTARMPSRMEVQRAATTLYYGELLSTYGGDRRKALAAVYAGREDVDAAVEAGGDDWLNLMDPSVEQFIDRGLVDD